ncbi:MAG: proline--tRNA ligase [Proteobacteria bacterium]|jgi:prolyl-tRNA synthetase|nr:proline--tRNA ligase [Pseudomonadota bacterium]
MKLSKFFLPILKDIPSDAKIKSHQLMLRAGMIRQSASGIYSWLPLGFKVLKKIEIIIREEQDRAGAQEMLMPTIQSADLWKESGRYDGYGLEMLRIKDRQDRELLYGPTNEELVTQIFRDNVKSYKSLPLILYHIQWKFRDEIRPRFGIMRCREFLMKDSYSFDETKEGARLSYNKMFYAYLKTFERLGLKAIPLAADTGPIGGDLSHEFIILADTGESQIYTSKKILDLKIENFTNDEGSLNNMVKAFTEIYSATDEKFDQSEFDKSVKKEDQLITRGIEVGHIFYFGDKYSKSMRALVNSSSGQNITVEMGSYGIGVSRLVGAIIEANYNNNVMKWPTTVTPFHVAIIDLGKKSENETKIKSQNVYEKLKENHFDVLLDDTDESPASKFKNFDLIGIPYQIIIGSKQKADEYEFKEVGFDKQIVSLDFIIKKLKEIYFN